MQILHNAQAVVPYETIVTRLEGIDADDNHSKSSGDLISAVVHKLRRKLARDWVIQNYWGIGLALKRVAKCDSKTAIERSGK